MKRVNHIAHDRIKAGLTQSELAAKLDVGETSVSNWENGVSFPPAERLIKLARALDVTVEELLGVKKE